MKDFDGFEVVVTQSDADTWEASLPKVPKVRMLGNTVNNAVFGLGIIWEEYKRDHGVLVAMKDKEYSGRFNTRIDKGLHKMLSIEAAAKGISLNALVCQKLKNSVRKPIDWSDLSVTGIEKDEIRGWLNIFFSNSDGDKVGISFMKHNLDQALMFYEDSDEERLKFFSTLSVIEVVSKFLTNRIIQSSISHIPLIEAFLVSDMGNISIYRIVREGS